MEKHTLKKYQNWNVKKQELGLGQSHFLEVITRSSVRKKWGLGFLSYMYEDSNIYSKYFCLNQLYTYTFQLSLQNVY